MPRGLRLLTLATCTVSWCLGDDAQCELSPFNTCKLKVGIVGGGTSLISLFHNISIGVGNTRRIVAGATHAKPERSLANAKMGGFTGYGHWKEMLDAWRKGEQDLDYVVILARSTEHYEPTKAFVEAGLAVFCEKPMTMTAAEAEEIQKLAEAKKVPFVMGHAQAGHPILMFARELVRSGAIGEVRKIESWFNQDWAAEAPGPSWRFDPKMSGIASCASNIGLDAYSLATWVSGRDVTRVSARLKSFEPSRELDESCSVMAELDNGGTALIMASFISVGFKNEHGLRIFGSKGSLEWGAGTSGVLIVRHLANAIKVYTHAGNQTEFPESIRAYPLDANLANLHITMEREIRSRRGEKGPAAYPYPDALQGVQAMRYLEAAVESSKQNNAWVDVKAAAGTATRKSSWF